MDKRYILRLKRRIFARHIRIARVSVLVGVILIVALILILILGLARNFGFERYYQLGKNFLITPPSSIASINDRTNILILGKSGGNNTAPDLTDSIILASINHDSKKMSLISFPRDLWIEGLRAKLNSVYYWGNERAENGGIALAKSEVEAIAGVPVHYAVVIDFNGFEDVINVLGGVNVNVEKTFVDKKYPIKGREEDLCDGDREYGCRYEIIEFTKGTTAMDGATALKFVRSRNSEDLEEGTDIARSARQQRVLSAIKNKALTSEILTSPRKITELIEVVNNIIETDIPEAALAVLARRGLQVGDNIERYTFPEDIITNPRIQAKYDYLYVFTPAAEDWSEVSNWVKSILP